MISPLVAPPFASDRNFGRIVKPQISVTESATGAPNARFCPGRLVTSNVVVVVLVFVAAVVVVVVVVVVAVVVVVVVVAAVVVVVVVAE